MNLSVFIDKISSKSQGNLPGDDAHMQMTPYKKGLKVKPEAPRLSAVMIMAYEKSGETEILLLKRSEYGGVHSAQVGFPGGKKDETDTNLQFTALRELAEETGIDQHKVNIITQITPMFIPPSNFMVYPFVGYCKEEFEIYLNERESQYYFGGRISDLLNEENLRTTDIATSYGKMKGVPYFHLNNEIIWGATAAILNEIRLILSK